MAAEFIGCLFNHKDSSKYINWISTEHYAQSFTFQDYDFLAPTANVEGLKSITLQLFFFI